MPAARRSPCVKKVDVFEPPVEIYRRFADLKSPSILLESARASASTGRISIIAKNPFLVFESKGRRIRLSMRGNIETLEGDPLDKLGELLARFSFPAGGAFPSFAGGAAGYFGYELKNLIEPSLRQTAIDDLGLPDIYLSFFGEGLVVDHEARCVYLFSDAGSKGLSSLEASFREALSGPGARLSRRRPAPTNDAQSAEILGDLSRQSFIRKVKKIQTYIRQGEIFQANLSQRFRFTVSGPAFRIYEQLRQINPSPFFGYLDARSFQIISGSPERLVKLENGMIETRPIAGTRARGRTRSEDLALSRDLLLDEKERAEHIMLVDLERNDVGRVAEYGSVRADELMVVEDYSHVKHIVSNVRGTLREGLGAVDVIRAMFPGGTITGAPKVRCMEILDGIEPVARGPYTGSMGYVGFNGDMDLNIIIRSLVVKNGKAYLQTGAGIVADSVPEKEYDETLYKAEAVLKSIFGEERTGAFFARCRKP